MSDVVTYNPEKIINIAERDLRDLIDKAQSVERCLNALRGSAPTPAPPSVEAMDPTCDICGKGRCQGHPPPAPVDASPLRVVVAHEAGQLRRAISSWMASDLHRIGDRLQAALARADVVAGKWEALRSIAQIAEAGLDERSTQESRDNIRRDLNNALAALSKEGGS